MSLDPCCTYLNQVEWYQKRILLKKLRRVMQKPVIWVDPMQGWEEHNTLHLGKSRWDVWAGGILVLEEGVSVAGGACEGGESLRNEQGVQS